METVAKMVLNDWQRGKLPYFIKPKTDDDVIPNNDNKVRMNVQITGLNPPTDLPTSANPQSNTIELIQDLNIIKNTINNDNNSDQMDTEITKCELDTSLYGDDNNLEPESVINDPEVLTEPATSPPTHLINAIPDDLDQLEDIMDEVISELDSQKTKPLQESDNVSDTGLNPDNAKLLNAARKIKANSKKRKVGVHYYSMVNVKNRRTKSS